MPGLGLIFWMTIAFGLVVYILKKFAWKPILLMLQERERQLVKSQSDARRIEMEMTQLSQLRARKLAEGEKLVEQMTIEAHSKAEAILEEAREKSREEARIIISRADETVEAFKKEAMQEIRAQISSLSIDMAEKILEDEFSDRDRNTHYVDMLLDKLVLN